MPSPLIRCSGALLLAVAVTRPVAVTAQILVRETPVGLVVPIPGTGTPGSTPGAGGGAFGTILPPTLSETRAFTDLRQLTPVAGLVPYEPNAVLWSDHAKKRRWFALNSAATTFGFRRDGSWDLPIGAVWVKHFDLELRRGDPTSARRVETRFLVRSPNDAEGRVTSYTYRWNEAQTDATLVPMAGATQDFQISENGVTRTQTWRFPGRLECQSCHNSVGGPILSFNTPQLNRTGPGGTTNQLTALARAGYLNTTNLPDPGTLPALVDAADPAHAVERRARSYLHVNCSQCHQPGISNAGTFDFLTNVGLFDARATIPLSLAGIVNGPLASGDAAQRVVVPGGPAASRLLAHMMTRGPGQMPPLATSERDLGAEALIAQWIAELARPQPPSRLLNVSARAAAGAGPNAVISGFVIAAGAPRSVLIRAAGPGLAGFGVNGPLGAPALTLFNAASTAIAANTRWGSANNVGEIRSASSRLGAFPFADNSADSALLVTLAPGAYSVHIESPAGSGVTLAEIYDADTASAGGLVNLSVRAQISAGDAVVIPGLVVSDGATKTVLIRAVGPGLAAFGVAGPLLASPTLSLFAGAEAFLTNTRWNMAANAVEIRDTARRVGAFALAEGSADSAIVANLSPGAYTVQVRSANAASGQVLVEVFEVP